MRRLSPPELLLTSLSLEGSRSYHLSKSLVASAGTWVPPSEPHRAKYQECRLSLVMGPYSTLASFRVNMGEFVCSKDCNSSPACTPVCWSPPSSPRGAISALQLCSVPGADPAGGSRLVAAGFPVEAQERELRHWSSFSAWESCLWWQLHTFSTAASLLCVSVASALATWLVSAYPCLTCSHNRQHNSKRWVLSLAPFYW